MVVTVPQTPDGRTWGDSGENPGEELDVFSTIQNRVHSEAQPKTTQIKPYDGSIPSGHARRDAFKLLISLSNSEFLVNS